MTKQVTQEEYRIWVIFHQIYDLMTRYEEDMIKEADITREQFFVLFLVELMQEASGGPVIMSELASALYRHANSVSLIIDRMEKRGFVQRVRDLADRRAIRLLVTEKGEETFTIALKRGRQLIKTTFSVFSHKEMQTFLSLLSTLKAKVDTNNSEKKMKFDPELMDYRKIAIFLKKRRVWSP